MSPSARIWLLQRSIYDRGGAISAVKAEYRVWCGQRGCAPNGRSELLDKIEKVCSKLGIEIEVGDDQRVYKRGDGRTAAVH